MQPTNPNEPRPTEAQLCHQALEKPAYDLQNDYLVSQGEAARFDKMFIRAAVGWCAEYL